MWETPESSEQLGSGVYISPKLGDWAGSAIGLYCAILADSSAWNLVNKAWVPEVDGCKPLWYGEGSE